MTVEEQISKLFCQEKQFSFDNINECQCTDDLTSNICDILAKFGIEDEDFASRIDSLMRIASSFFTIGTLYYIDQLRKG